MKVLFISIMLISCGQATSKDKPSEYKMRCEKVGHRLKRCENQEVVCYIFRGSTRAMQCIPKGSI